MKKVDTIVVTPDNEYFDDLKKSVRSINPYNIDYEELAEQYNSSPIGSIILIEGGERVRANNVIAVIKKRGVEYKVDFSAGKVMKDSKGNSIPPADRPIAITKNTDTEMELRNS